MAEFLLLLWIAKMGFQFFCQCEPLSTPSSLIRINQSQLYQSNSVHHVVASVKHFQYHHHSLGSVNLTIISISTEGYQNVWKCELISTWSYHLSSTFFPLTKKRRVEEGRSSGSSKDGWFGTGGIVQSEQWFFIQTCKPKVIAGLALEASLNLENDTW